MRKIFAYVVSLLTIVMAIALCVPSISESTKFAMEYTGGFEVLYKVTSETDDVKNNEVAKTISDGMVKMLDINEITDTVITVENGNYIRVNVTSKSQIISDQIRNVLQNKESYEISFRDSNDTLLATGDEILKSVGASYSGETDYNGYPIINLNIAKTDLLRDITTTVSNADTKNLVIWVGFEEGVDSYANIETNSETAKKVIYNATVSEALSDEVINITGNYTEDMAKKTVNLINSGTYDYELELVQLKSIKEADATNTKTLVIIACGVIAALAIVALVVLFKLNGIHAIATVVLADVLTLFAFTKIAGVINPQVIGAFILSTIVMFALYYLVLNKYKAVVKINKSPIKAYRETFKKNNPIVIDTCLTILIFALVTYFLGNNAEQFAIYLACSSIVTLFSLLVVERFVMYLSCDWFNKNDKTVIMSASSLSKTSSESGENSNEEIDIDAYAKHTAIGFGGLAVLAIIVSLIFTLAIKAPFGFYGDAKESSRLEIIANEEKLVDEEEVMEFFDAVNIELTDIELKTENGKYHIIVTSDTNFTSNESLLHEKLADLYGENKADGSIEYYVVYINDYNPTSVLISFTSTLYTSSIALLAIAIYFAIRYKYSYSLATVTTVVMTTVSLLAFFAITRIPVNTQTTIAISIVNTLSIITLVPFFSKINELMKEVKKPYLSYDERVACFTKGRDLIMMPTIITVGLFVVLSLVTMFFDLQNFSMYLAVIIGSLFALVYNMIIVPRVWLLFETKREERRRIFKNRDYSKSKFRPIDEQVFIGIND